MIVAQEPSKRAQLIYHSPGYIETFEVRNIQTKVALASMRAKKDDDRVWIRCIGRRLNRCKEDSVIPSSIN
jgi:hypothetical protein